jgi:hypothetical protein
MSRFNTNAFRSLNESIARVQNPQAALDEAMEYTALLEEVLLALCEELELDPNALLEDVQTYERSQETKKKSKKLWKNIEKATNSGNDQQHRRAVQALDKHDKQVRKEVGSKTLYAKGGKTVRKGTAAHAAETKKSDRGFENMNKRIAAWHKSQQGTPEYNAWMAGYDDVDQQKRAERFLRGVGVKLRKR